MSDTKRIEDSCAPVFRVGSVSATIGLALLISGCAIRMPWQPSLPEEDAVADELVAEAAGAAELAEDAGDVQLAEASHDADGDGEHADHEAEDESAEHHASEDGDGHDGDHPQADGDGAAAVEAVAVAEASAVVEDVAPFETADTNELLDRSIEFHDPGGVWGSDEIPMTWTGSRPDGKVSMDLEISFGPNSAFSMVGDYAGLSIDYQVAAGTWSATVDGESDYSDEVRERAVLSAEDGLFWRNYFGFLGGLPMNLRDSSVWLEAEPWAAEFQGRDVQAMRACFSRDIGSDIWTMYFDPVNGQLLGCRFDRTDSDRDGETLVFEDLEFVAGLWLPKRRRWYMNADDEYLGMDELSVRSE